MQKWEYLFIPLQITAHKNQLYPFAQHGKELPNWENGPTLSQYFNQYGEQGWELISVEDRVYIFKRPKP